jgi:putative ABC transport system permease protein
VRKFNADPAVVGKSIRISGGSYLVSGVMPASFESLMNQDPRGGTVEIWRVLGYDVKQPWACRTCHHLVAIGRLREGVSIAKANAEMDTISAALTKAYPKEYSASGVIIDPLHEHLLGAASTPLYILLGAVFFVLLVACANLANLLLAHGTHREREFALRAALGASRRRIIRQLLVENLVLAAFGAMLAFIPAGAAPRLLQAIGPADLPRVSQIQIDWRVLLFAALMVVITGAISGLVPAIRLSRTDLRDSLNEASRGNSAGMRTRRLLVTAEIALSLTLLTGAGLLLQSLWRLMRVSPGFDPAAVLTLQSSAVGPQYADNNLLRRLVSTDVANLRAIPGVQTAAAASEIPLGGNVDRYGFHPEGKMHANPELDESAERYCVTPGFLTAMRIPLLRGRDIADTDTDATPGVILINEVTARQVWPNEDAIGKRVKLGGIDGPWFSVVGIAGDIHHRSLDEPPSMQVYVPHTQWPFPDSRMTFVLRTLGPPATFAGSARQAIRLADATQAISRALPLSDYLSISVQGRRFALLLIGAFASMAVLLSSVGIYGVTAYSVAQRTHEIGIRMALGAPRKEVLQLLLKEGLWFLGGGLVAGFVISFSLMRFLQTLLFQVTPTDPMTMGVVVLLLAGVVAIASYVPAMRALQVDPIIALRHD